MKLPDLQKAKIRNQSEVKYCEADILRDRSLFQGKKYFLKTYGCQMNVHDSELIKNLIEGIGFIETDSLKDADLVILNTCAIRENAHDKVFGFLGRCKHEKASRKDMIISICGCMAQEPSVCEEILRKHKYVDLVFGTHNIHDLPNMLKNKMSETSIEVESIEGNVYENLEYKRDSKIEAWINIMYGCDKFCTYCIVPYTRGKQRSRKIENIKKEIEKIASIGIKEVVLTGIQIAAYGKDQGKNIELIDLLEKINEINRNRKNKNTAH